MSFLFISSIKFYIFSSFSSALWNTDPNLASSLFLGHKIIVVTFVGTKHGCHRRGWMVQVSVKEQFSCSDRSITEFVLLQKQQDIVIHRIQFLKITNYTPRAAGHQISLLLEVCHLIWLKTLLSAIIKAFICPSWCCC